MGLDDKIQLFEDNGDDTAGQQDNGKVRNEIRQMHLKSSFSF